MARQKRTCAAANSAGMYKELSQESSPKTKKNIKKASAKTAQSADDKKAKAVPSSDAAKASTSTVVSSGSMDAAAEAKASQKGPVNWGRKMPVDAGEVQIIASLGVRAIRPGVQGNNLLQLISSNCSIF